MRYRIEGPAVDRLEWLLDGLAGRPGWGADAAEVLAPSFLADVVTAEVFVEIYQRRALTYAPLTVLGLEVVGETARARIRRPAQATAGAAASADAADAADAAVSAGDGTSAADGVAPADAASVGGTAVPGDVVSAGDGVASADVASAGHEVALADAVSAGDAVDIVSCTVEAEAPHRILASHTSGLVPDYLTARLPADFAGYPLPEPGLIPGARRRPRLIVFSGVPGVGKSTLADAVGARLGIPVFATDWLLGALTPFGGRHFDDQFGIAGELLTTLALRQLTAGQCAILDHPSEDVADRERWASLARRVGAEFVAVHCVCSDQAVHRDRLEGRTRGIPGWHDAGAWSNVQGRLAAFPPWPADTLTIDTANPKEENLATVIAGLS